MIDELIRRASVQKVHIAVVGDPMVDEWVIGRSEDCQDGCKKFVPEETIWTAGGARNAAEQLRNWNCDSKFVGIDHHGQFKTRHIDQNGKIVYRIDGTYELSESMVATGRAMVLNGLNDSRFDGVLISDYDKGWLDAETIRWVIDFCKDRGIPCVADPKREPGLFTGAVLKVNEEYEKKHKRLSKPHVVTKGAIGPVSWDEESIVAHQLLPNVTCVCHIGAGDCFAAHLIFALAHGMDFHDACEMAYSAGRVYVQHPFSRAPFPHEIRKDMTGSKIVEDVSSLKKSLDGKKVVFTNGCFDLLGPHHIRLLKEAKTLGDVLVVGLNGDQGVRKLKGPCRPVVGLDDRIAMLSALECVDWVIPFESVRPLELLETLRPDVLVKGDDPHRDTAGDEFAGRVQLIPLSSGSTTSTIERIVKGNGATAL